MDYDAMLKEARETLPERKDSKERFEVPKVRGQLEGTKTIISNFQQIAETLGRPATHLLKYVQKELATPGQFRKQAVIFGSKIPANKFNDKINAYAEEFVLCKECSRPDTKMTKEGYVYYLKCHACGARYSFYAKI